MLKVIERVDSLSHEEEGVQMFLGEGIEGDFSILLQGGYEQKFRVLFQ